MCQPMRMDIGEGAGDLRDDAGDDGRAQWQCHTGLTAVERIAEGAAVGERHHDGQVVAFDSVVVARQDMWMFQCRRLLCLAHQFLRDRLVPGIAIDLDGDLPGYWPIERRLRKIDLACSAAS